MKAIPIIPSGRIIPDPRQQKRAIENALDGTAAAIKIDFDVTTQSWSERSQFKIERPKWSERLIVTDDPKYRYVTGGTPPHTIQARNAPFLIFQWGGPGSYQAKTTPRVIASRPGGPSGPTVYRQSVLHPGTQAREFEIAIGDKWQKEWPRQLARAIASEF